MRNVIIIATLVLCLAAVSVRADLLECDQDEKVDEPRSALKKFGCQITKKAKEWGIELKENAKKWREKAKDLGSDIKTKFNDFRTKLSSSPKDSEEDEKVQTFLNRQVELINTDVVKGEQMCGHGHILDALGNCSKLRK